MIGTSYGTVGIKKMRIGTEIQFIVWPRKCNISDKWIWLKKAYKETHMYTGPGDPLFEYFYYEKHTYLTSKLKGEI